jgi:hypothetical protein
MFNHLMYVCMYSTYFVQKQNYEFSTLSQEKVYYIGIHREVF